jgi:hypothetical protein
MRLPPPVVAYVTGRIVGPNLAPRVIYPFVAIAHIGWRVGSDFNAIHASPSSLLRNHRECRRAVTQPSTYQFRLIVKVFEGVLHGFHT